MANSTNVQQGHPFYQTKLACQSLLQLWNFSFVRLLGLPQDNHPALRPMDQFFLAAQTDSLQSASSLEECSPLYIPIITDQSNMPLAVFAIYISLDNPADSVDTPPNPDVEAKEEQCFRNHSIQLSYQIPVDPEFMVNAWSEELLRRIQALTASGALIPSTLPGQPSKAEDAIIPALRGISAIDLIKVNTSANVRIPKPYRLDPRHTVGSKTKLLTVAPVNPRVVQFALSPRGSARLQITPPTTSSAAAISPISLFVGSAGVRLHGSSTTIQVPPTANRARRLAAQKEMETVLCAQYPVNTTATTPSPAPQQPPTYASLFHKPATPPYSQQQQLSPQQSNPLFVQTPTNMEHDAQDSNQVHPSSWHLPTFPPNYTNLIPGKHKFTTYFCPSLTPYSDRFCYYSSNLLLNNSRPRCSCKRLRTRRISYNKNCMLQTRTGKQQRLNWLPCKHPKTLLQLNTWSIPVGTNRPTRQVTLGPGALSAHSGSRRESCTNWKPHSKALSLPYVIPQARRHLPTQTPSQYTDLTNAHPLAMSSPLQPSHLVILNTIDPPRSLPRRTPLWIKPRKSHIQADDTLKTKRLFRSNKPRHPDNRTSLPPISLGARPLHYVRHNTAYHVPVPNTKFTLPPTPHCSHTTLQPSLIWDPDQLLQHLHSAYTRQTPACLTLPHRHHTKTTHNKTSPLQSACPHSCSCVILPVKSESDCEMISRKLMPNQSSVITMLCSQTSLQIASIPYKPGCIPCDSSLPYANITLISLITPPQILIISKICSVTLAPAYTYTTPRNIVILIIRTATLLKTTINKGFLPAAGITLNNLLIPAVLVYILMSRSKNKARKPRAPRSNYRLLQRGTNAPIKTWLNTLPDRFGSTVLSPPTMPWPHLSIMNPQWQPVLPHRHTTHRQFSRINKSAWNKYVKAKNKALLCDITKILLAIIPHISFPLTSRLTTHLPPQDNDYDHYASLQIVIAILSLVTSAAKSLILSIITDPRTLLLMLLMCAGDIHPNPGPPNITPILLDKYNSSTPSEFTSWIRKQNHRYIHFGDPNGKPYATRSDMLSGFFQEYLDKSDQTTLISMLLRRVYTLHPHLSQTEVKVVRAAEEHDMQRGETPFNWLNPEQTTTVLRARADIMHNPLDCKALVIPRVANSHFTTYVLHPEGVAYYDSLSFPPDTTIISKYHDALNNFYTSNPDLATPLIKQTLHNISHAPPVRVSCTKQTPEPAPWSCGYCSANVCIQAVFQQAVPTINQPLEDIYGIQSAFLKHKVTGQTRVWDSALHALLSPPPPSPTTLNYPNISLSPPPNLSLKTSFKPSRRSKRVINKQRSNPATTKPLIKDQSRAQKTQIPPTTTQGLRQSNLKQTTLDFKAACKTEIGLSPLTQHTKVPNQSSHNVFHHPLLQNELNTLDPNHEHNCRSDAPPNTPTNQTPSEHTPHPGTFRKPVEPVLTKQQKAQLTKARKIITRRNNQNKKNKLRPITTYLTTGGPQSIAIKRQQRTFRPKKYKAANLFTYGCSLAKVANPHQKRPDSVTVRLRPLQEPDPEYSQPYRPPTPPFSQEPSTPQPSPPSQHEPIEDILEAHNINYNSTANPETDHNITTTDLLSTTPPNEWESNPVQISVATLNLSKGGENGLSLLDLEQLINEKSPDILLLTETPYANKSKPLTNLLKRLQYKYSYDPTPPPTLDQTHLPKEARLPKAAIVHSTGGALCAYKKDKPWANFVTHVTTPDHDINSRVAAIKIQHPTGDPRIIAAVYIPHKRQELKRTIWAYLKSLPITENIQYVLIGGDFQENIHLPKSTARKENLHPVTHIPAPTFCPPHVPQINTTIDGFITAHAADPWNMPHNTDITNIPTAYADHHALLLTIYNSNFPHINIPDVTQAIPPPRLKLPLEPKSISKWQAEVRHEFTHQIQGIIKAAKKILATHQDHQDSAWAEDSTKQLVLHYADEITEILTLSTDKAYDIMPLVPTPRPSKISKKQKPRPRWSEQKTEEIKDAANRTRLLRKFNNAGKHKNSKPYLVSDLMKDLQTIPIVQEFATDLLLTPNQISNDSTTADEITHVIKQHKKYTKRIVAAAKKENTQKYSRFLENLFEQKPKKALETIIATQKGTDKNQKLTLVKEVETGKLYSQTEDCLAAITAEQTTNLAATVSKTSPSNYPWEEEGCPDPITLTHPPDLPTTLLNTITRADYDLCLKKSGNGKATGPDNIPGEIIKSMPPEFHDALFLIFTLLARTRTTPKSWLQSKTVLIYKKGDPSVMDNYRPIALANHLYKVWTSVIALILTEFAECNHLLSDSQEGYRKGRSTNRAVAHLQLLLEDAHTHNKNIYITYIDFKGAYPSVDHTQLRKVIRDLGIPQDVCDLIESLHNEAHTTFLTPHGSTPPIPIGRGTLQGDPLSTILFDLMMEPLTRWLQKGKHGYSPVPTGTQHEGILYADDVALTTKSIKSISQQQLLKIEKFGEWSHIRVNPNKCRTTAWVPKLQSITKKADRDTTLKDSLAHITILGKQIPTLAQDEPLSGGYLGCQLTASLQSGPQKQWLNDTLKEAQTAIQSAPVTIRTKIAMVQYLIYSKVRYTMGLMMYDHEFLARMDSIIATIIKQAWKLPRYFPTAAAQCSTQDLGLDSPSLAMDYGATAAAMVKDLLNDSGRLGQLARTSLNKQLQQKQTWPEELILDPGIGFLGKAYALLQKSGTKIDGLNRSWQGNNLCSALSNHIRDANPNSLDPTQENAQPQYPPIRKVLRRTKPLWSNGITDLNQLITPRSISNPPQVLITHEDLQRRFPSIAKCNGTAPALKYLADLLTSNSLEEFSNNRSRHKMATQPPRSIASRWTTGESPLSIGPVDPNSQATGKTPHNQTNSHTQNTTRHQPWTPRTHATNISREPKRNSEISPPPRLHIRSDSPYTPTPASPQRQ